MRWIARIACDNATFGTDITYGEFSQITSGGIICHLSLRRMIRQMHRHFLSAEYRTHDFAVAVLIGWRFKWIQFAPDNQTIWDRWIVYT